MSETDHLKLRQLEYIPTNTVAHFFSDFTTQFCAIMSPVGLGKTSALIMKALRIAKRQCPDRNGVRWTRIAFARGTYQQLIDSTVKSFQFWIPDHVCKLRRSPPIFGEISMMPLHDQNRMFEPGTIIDGEDWSGRRIGDRFPEGTYVNADFRFMALDSQNAIGDLRSTEYTIINLDEPDQMEYLEDTLTEAQSRIGRYPEVQTAPITCSQINMSYNPPAYGSFLEKYFREEYEKLSRKLYRIPSPLLPVPDKQDPDDWFKMEFIRNPDAEGIHIQPKGLTYWEDIVNANRHDPDKITRLVLGDYTHGSGGRPIYPAFSHSKHVQSELSPRRGAKIIASLDWGMFPCSVFVQFFDGKLHVLSELTTNGDTPVHEFVREDFILYARSQYAGYEIVVTGDPSGTDRRDTGDTPFSIVASSGFHIMPHTSRDPEKRWSAVNYFINRDMIKVDAACENLVGGFLGGYQWEKATGNKSIRKALKNNYSHPQDALQAACLYVQGGHDTVASHVDVLGFQESEKNSVVQSKYLMV